MDDERTSVSKEVTHHGRIVSDLRAIQRKYDVSDADLEKLVLLVTDDRVEHGPGDEEPGEEVRPRVCERCGRLLD